ncbi:Serine palmitoyltransferase 2 [Mycena kentingensis (nom. inval.)]|nr:Serine palmitoyltransferase 2 [Mycena kentingensis (nom. inval.)]
MASRTVEYSPDPEEIDALETDEFVAIFPTSRSRSAANRAPIDEQTSLLGDVGAPRKKPFYRPRPLWLVPFAIIAALVRGMTLAPRVTVFKTLACDQIAPKEPQNTFLDLRRLPLLRPDATRDTHPVPIMVYNSNGESSEFPTRRCTADPIAVEGRAAKIQAAYAMTMGLLSAFTTGWWGTFGDRYGRTRLLAVSTLGWFLTDLCFILTSTPGSPLADHGGKLVLIAPVFEGLLGGWSTLQSGTSAYISDCTSSGSRASVFSRFTGVGFLGFSLGPMLGAWLIRHPLPLFAGHPSGGQTVTTVFWAAALGSLINFVFVFFILPESVPKNERVSSPVVRHQEVIIAGVPIPKHEGSVFLPPFVVSFLSPLRTFLPAKLPAHGNRKARRDWSLTLLVMALFGYLLSAGLYQIKYLYGSHVYSWTPEQLSYYISFMGGGRALFLLFAFPLVISTFKPKSTLPPAAPNAAGIKVKPKPTKEHLAREIKFDLRLARISLCIDIMANTAIVLAPAPTYTMDLMSTPTDDAQFRSSQALFVMASWTASWGAGLIPAIHSLALSIMQSRVLLAEDAGDNSNANSAGVDTGKLFGALAILQATGQMILGPMLFALIYSNTVATYPKAVFGAAIGILFLALSVTLLVRSPLAELRKNNGKAPEVLTPATMSLQKKAASRATTPAALLFTGPVPIPDGPHNDQTPPTATPALSLSSSVSSSSDADDDMDNADGLAIPPRAPTSYDNFSTVHTEFGHCNNEKFRFTSKDDPKAPVLPHIEQAPYYILLSTYISYLILIVLGHVRDFLGKRFRADSYKHLMPSNGYAPLNSDFDSFYTRRLKTRMDECFSQPVTGVAGRTIQLLDRYSADYNHNQILTGGKTRALNISSYNYLRHGVSSCGSRLEGGSSDLHGLAESLVARFVGQDDALISSMGFATNSAYIPALVGKGCLVISDELNHASIRFGVRLSGASVRMFKHNNMKSLEKLLREVISQGQPKSHRPWKKILVIVEGLFSMEGTLLDLPRLVELKQRYKFALWVDEAHSIGALGPHGRGVADYFGVPPKSIDILMGTFTKSFGAAGGYIAGSKALIDRLRVRGHSGAYAESMAPPVLTQVIASMASIMGIAPPVTRSSSSSSTNTVTAVQPYDFPGRAPASCLPTWLSLPRPLADGSEGHSRLRRLAFNSRYLHRGLIKLGFITYGHPASPIVPLLLFNPGKMCLFHRMMKERQTPIIVVVVAYPATPLVTSRVRFCVSAAHTKEDIDTILIACDEVGDVLDLKHGLGRSERWGIDEIRARAVELANEE